MSNSKTYRLGSSGLVFAPGLIAWAINGYRSKRAKDRAAMENVVSDSWGLPISATRALLSGKAPHKVEGDVVEFEFA